MKKRVRHPRHPEHFVPVIDWWVITLIVILLFILISAIPFLLWQPLGWQAKVVGSLGLLCVILYFIDTAFFTVYQLTDEGIVINNQLRETTVPYRAIKSIRPATVFNLFSFAKHKRFSLSGQALILHLEGHDWRTISVSPHERQRFLDHLLNRIEIERSSRSAVTKE